MTRRWVVTIMVAGIVTRSTVARTETDAAMAERLFRDGRALLEAGKTAEACEMLAESQRLDPAGGTLLNLALCHERQGKLATAWAEFVDARAQARVQQRTDRVELAEAHIRALEPRVPRIRIVLPPDHADATLVLDAKVLGSAAIATELPVDPGTRRLVFSRPGRQTWSAEIVMTEASVRTVNVPALEPVPAASRVLPYSFGIAGLVALGAGGYFGVRAIQHKSVSDDHCEASVCDEIGLAAHDRYKRAAWGANIGIGAGVVSLAVAGVLLWRARREDARHATAYVAATSGGAEIVISGAF
ncbi:MAG: hypothetical protein AB7P03_21315 [Kofleriaceae bacterium]